MKNFLILKEFLQDVQIYNTQTLNKTIFFLKNNVNFIMLYNIFIDFIFRRFCQSGFYFDFFFKKLTEIFIRNFFIYGAQFFGEKYLIEVLTRKVFNIHFIFFACF